MHLQLGLIPLALLCAATLACAAENKLEQARDFQQFDTWWLGEQFEEFNVTGADETALLYGDCEPAPDAGCPPPIQVIMESLCERPRLDVQPAGEEEPLRGDATFQQIREGQALVRTGTVAITLFARDDATTRRMAAALESRNIEPPVGPGEHMPAPDACDNR